MCSTAATADGGTRPQAAVPLPAMLRARFSEKRRGSLLGAAGGRHRTSQRPEHSYWAIRVINVDRAWAADQATRWSHTARSGPEVFRSAQLQAVVICQRYVRETGHTAPGGQFRFPTVV